jgi:peptidoglycan/LPS O-acetylase OafA/YrhL
MKNSRRFGYEPSLDGLRGLAVLAVVGYHIHSLDSSRLSFLKGGFFGVELFFVVSGFLITSLLWQEFTETGTIALGAFWMRRARRLLPALFAMLIAVGISAALWRHASLGRLRRDIPWSLLYLSNWGQIFDSANGYFAQLGTPPLLRHLWSLAVEEQWYLIWPIAFGFALRKGGRRLAAMLAGLGVLAAFVGIVVGNGTSAKANFTYLSTITRSSGLLLGAALAVAWRPWRSRTASTRTLPFLDLAALGALFVVTVAVMSWANTSTIVYRGGMLVVSLASAVLIAAAVHPGAVLTRRLFSSTPLRELGRRSYGLYLWHWPILVLTRAVQSSMRLIFVLMLVAVVTEVSFRIIEEPLRRGWLGAWLRKTATRPIDRVAAGVAVCALVLPLIVVVGRAKHTNIIVGGTAAAFELKADATSDPSDPAAAPGNDMAVAEVATSTAPAGPVRVVVVGDSQAQALASNTPDGLDAFLSITDGAVDGCGVWDDGTIWSRQGMKRPNGDCIGWSRKWGASATQANAEIALVVIGAWDVFDIAYKEGVTTFNSPAWDAKFAASLQKGVTALTAAGTKVALLEVACMHPVFNAGAVVPPLPERGEAWRTAHVNDLLKRFAAANPGAVTFIAGPTEWCNNPTIANDTNYRWDGVHVYKPGGKLIFETITPALLQLVGR